ncbi:hypothetical protein BLOT_002893 [Blomia tropicalis]|nr:hypothetical protein BLOT_002893 [Blomia tropicalis]
MCLQIKLANQGEKGRLQQIMGTTTTTTLDDDDNGRVRPRPNIPIRLNDSAITSITFESTDYTKICS